MTASEFPAFASLFVTERNRYFASVYSVAPYDIIVDGEVITITPPFEIGGFCAKAQRGQV